MFQPVYVHNLKNYDGHLIVNAMSKYGYQENNNNIISAIPNNEERYISFSKKVKVGSVKAELQSEKQQWHMDSKTKSD